MKVTITVDETKIIAHFDAMPGKVHDSLERTVTVETRSLADLIRRKLSGEVLGVVTGNLRRSVFEQVDDRGSAIIGRVHSAADVPYGAIHEYGGKTAAHEIIARNAKALSFMTAGGRRFAKRVNHPGSRMPERSFMRSSLDDRSQAIRDALERAIADGLEA
jgi:phage gpG-like protein